MKNIFRLSIIIILVAVQALVPIAAQARTQMPAMPAAPAMPPALYSAFLDASAKSASASQTAGIKTSFSATGLAVAPQKGAAWKWNLQLDSFGRLGKVSRLSAPKVALHNGRTEMSYSALTEWYRTTGVGLEQGFTIAQKPSGIGKLVLHMQLDTSLSGSLSPDSHSLTFAAGKGQLLHYSNLRAVDAGGQELPAQLVYAKGQIAIQLDDRAAAYPITVDPLMFVENELATLDGAKGENFGSSVAIDGNTALVGASFHTVGSTTVQGAAYIFMRQGSTWVQQAELTASDGASNDQFGCSVAISGNTAVIGACNHNSSAGEAYVFVQPVSGWADSTETARLTASNGAASDYFGYSVAISGDVALVGDNVHSSHQGQAYVFVKPAGGWATGNETARLTASDAAVGDRFGMSVAISGNTVIIGAPYHNGNRGEAYLFVKPAGGWATTNVSFIQTASDMAANDQFGISVAISGSTAIVGADGYSSNRGKAYVFVKPAGGWVAGHQVAILTPSDPAVLNNFGYSTAVSGDTVLIGEVNAGLGEAYLFVKPAGGWIDATQSSILTASDGATGDLYGQSVAISGASAFVGANAHNASLGAAYAYSPDRSEDLGVAAYASTLSPRAGQTINFTVTVSNFAANPSLDVMVGAPLPDGFSLVSAAAGLGSYDPLTGDWTIATLGADVVASLELHATVASAAIGTSPVFTAALLGWDTKPADDVSTVTMDPVPYLGISPSTLAFGSQAVGATLPGQVVTVTNQTYGSVTFGSITAPPVLSLTNDTCSGSSLASLASCTFKVQFIATSLGPASATVNIPTTAPVNTSLSLPASGTGISPLSFSPSQLLFSDQPVGIPSPFQTVSVTNTSTVSVTLGSLVVPSGFQVGTDTCSGSGLPASTTCMLRVQFNPASTAIFSDDLSLPITNLADMSAKLPVSGNGVPLLTTSPAPVTFSSQTIGTLSSAQTVTVTNQSSLPVTFGTFSAPSGFVLSADSCSSLTVVPGGYCSFNVQFKPTSATSYAGSISLPATSPHLANTLAISGTGLPLLSFSPNPVTFASQLIQTTSPAQTVTITNVSSVSATLGTLVAPTGFVLSANTCSSHTLLASGTCTFAVQFKPTAASSYSANLTVPVTSPAISLSLPVSGTGLAGTQLLTNASFETDANHDKVPDGWAKAGTWATSDGQDCTVHHTGKCALKFTGTKVTKSLTFTITKSGGSGNDFLLTLWRNAASVPSGSTLDANVKIYNGTTLVATKTVTLPVGTYAFTQSSLPFTMTASYTKLVVTLEFKANSGTLWFDDASLVWAP